MADPQADDRSALVSNPGAVGTGALRARTLFTVVSLLAPLAMAFSFRGMVTESSRDLMLSIYAGLVALAAGAWEERIWARVPASFGVYLFVFAFLWGAIETRLLLTVGVLSGLVAGGVRLRPAHCGVKTAALYAGYRLLRGAAGWLGFMVGSVLPLPATVDAFSPGFISDEPWTFLTITFLLVAIILLFDVLVWAILQNRRGPRQVAQ